MNDYRILLLLNDVPWYFGTVQRIRSIYRVRLSKAYSRYSYSFQLTRKHAAGRLRSQGWNPKKLAEIGYKRWSMWF